MSEHTPTEQELRAEIERLTLLLDEAIADRNHSDALLHAMLQDRDQLRAAVNRAHVLILEATPYVDHKLPLNADMRNFSLRVPNGT